MDIQYVIDSVIDSRKLDLEKLLELSTAMHREIQALRGKEVTLVIGKTGSGKSTLINYLLKNKLIKTDDKEDTGEFLIQLDRMTVEEETTCNNGEQFAEIGHEFVSETLYPKGFETENGLLLCDTAGFGDNRSSENNAAAYLAVQMIIQSAALIKGIIVVVSVDDFKGRATGLNKTLSLLKRLILDNENCIKNFQNSVVFVFTHADNDSGEVKTEQQILVLLKKAQRALVQQLNGDPNNEDLRDSLALCNIMLLSEVKIVVFHPFVKEQIVRYYFWNPRAWIAWIYRPKENFKDNPIGRDLILSFIEQSDGIAKEDISFRVEKIFQRYSDTVCRIANSFLRSHRVIIDEQSHIQQYEQKIENIKRKISKLIEVNTDLEKHGKVNTYIGNLMMNLKDDLRAIKEEIGSLKNKASNNKAKHLHISRAKYKLENDITHVLVYTENKYCENTVYGIVNKGVVHSKIFDYSQAYPIAQVDYVGANYTLAETEGTPEKFSEPVYNKDRTRCTIRYDGPSHEYGRAEFMVYSEKRLTPDAKCKIKRYKDELESFENDLKEFESALKKAREQEDNLSMLITHTESQNIEDTKSLIESNEKMIEVYKKELKELSEELNKSFEKLESAKHTLMEQESQYQMLLHFNDIVPFEEQTVQEFICEYQFYASGATPFLQ